jgi:hypothetical protein
LKADACAERFATAPAGLRVESRSATAQPAGRRASGAPLVAWCGFAPGNFTFTSGAPTIYKSSPRVERGFCANCGTQLTYRRLDDASFVDVTIASLDDPEAIPPQDHTWVRGRLSWIKLADGLPVYTAQRTN